MLLVKGQIGGAADHVSPRSTPSGRWMVTLLAPPRMRTETVPEGLGKHYSDSAGAAGQLDRTESELAKVCGEPRGATVRLYVPGDRGVERDLGATLEQESS